MGDGNWQESVGEIEVEIEAGQVPARLIAGLLDEELREDHAALGMVGMRQRHEAPGEDVLVPDLLRRHPGQRVPCHSRRRFHADTALDRLATAHRGAGDRAVAEVVARREKLLLTLLYPGFR